MHDCRKFKDKLIDLLFDTAEGDEKARLCEELSSCESCRTLYHSMSDALTVFDQVAQTAAPKEEYWNGYEERLRARLTAAPEQKARRRVPLFLKDLFGRIPLPLRVAFACLVIGVGLWLFAGQAEKTDAPVAVDNGKTDSGQKELARKDEEPQGTDHQIPETQKPETQKPEPQKRDAQRTERQPDRLIDRKPRQSRAHLAREARPDRVTGQASEELATARRSGSADRLSPEVASHVEKAELLMRSFRNIKPSEGQPVFDVEYEKQLSKELLARNRRLRRSAESRREFAVEDLLTSIEPLLLDIANLTDSPTETDVRTIKDLIQSQEIVAALQLYSAKASSRIY